jgi:hypothetical protein
MSRSTRRLLAGAAALTLAVLLAGCGGSSDPASAAAGSSADPAAADGGGSTDGGCTSDYGVTICMTYDIKGAETMKGTSQGTVSLNKDASATSCAEWVAGAPDGDDGRPQLFLPQGGAITADSPFGGMTGSSIQHYEGPGTYDKKDLSGQGSEAGLLIGGKDYGQFEDSSTATVTVEANGNGSYTFSGLTAANGDSKPAISGTVTWECKAA